MLGALTNNRGGGLVGRFPSQRNSDHESSHRKFEQSTCQAHNTSFSHHVSFPDHYEQIETCRRDKNDGCSLAKKWEPQPFASDDEP